MSVCIVQIFLSYDDYLEQLDLYMRREWTCALSKRKNLTFEEVRVHLWERRGIDSVLMQLSSRDITGSVHPLFIYRP